MVKEKTTTPAYIHTTACLPRAGVGEVLMWRITGWTPTQLCRDMCTALTVTSTSLIKTIIFSIWHIQIFSTNKEALARD
uniref:Uncharacterized protein n=1 Tax=Anguilla anguilla TaxID=7936 RepID=A0A0E9WZ88_ANGAN